jgi:hypothetical protein
MTLITRITEWQVQQMTLDSSGIYSAVYVAYLPKRFVRSITVFYCIRKRQKLKALQETSKVKLEK